MSGASLSGADLVGALLDGALLPTKGDAEQALVDRVLERHLAWLMNGAGTAADLSGMDLSGMDLSEANLAGASLAGAFLARTDLRGASLVLADLSGAVLIGADLRDADLRGASLKDTDLTGANLSGARTGEARIVGGGGEFTGRSVDTDFTDARGGGEPVTSLGIEAWPEEWLMGVDEDSDGDVETDGAGMDGEDRA
jgi:hypothetical protein